MADVLLEKKDTASIFSPNHGNIEERIFQMCSLKMVEHLSPCVLGNCLDTQKFGKFLFLQHSPDYSDECKIFNMILETAVAKIK